MRTPAAVRQACDFGFGGGVGSEGLSLVGASEGAVAELDSLDPQTLPAEWEPEQQLLAMARDRSTVASRAASSSRSGKSMGAPNRSPADTPHFDQDRQQGGKSAEDSLRLIWFSIRAIRRAGVCSHTQPDRHSHGLDRIESISA
jgi:hypothetical protein